MPSAARRIKPSGDRQRKAEAKRKQNELIAELVGLLRDGHSATQLRDNLIARGFRDELAGKYVARAQREFTAAEQLRPENSSYPSIWKWDPGTQWPLLFWLAAIGLAIADEYWLDVPYIEVMVIILFVVGVGGFRALRFVKYG